MKVAFYTLGCKVNHYETQAMLELFLAAGYESVPFSERADVYVVNTCTVTQVSDQKSRHMLARAHRMNPDALVAAVGCYAQTAAEAVAALEGVSLVVGTDGRRDIVRLVESALAAREAAGAAVQPRAAGEVSTADGGPAPARRSAINEVHDLKTARAFEELSAVADSRTRATLKIQDGCRNFCTYCAIPYARGPIRSRPLESIRRELTRLAAEGYREVVLTGIHLASWGLDSGEGDLNDVLRMAAGIDGLPRIRLGSLEPKFCDERFAETVAALPAVCPQFHLSLQSGSDAVLKRMNRRYTTEEYLRSVALLREASPSCAITTDVIAGFVGETQQEHEETLAFVERAAFARIHVFPYSRRRGTKADAMPGHLPKRVREARAAELIRLGDRLETAFVAGMAGKRANVLIESGGEGYTENYVRVRIVSGGGLLPVDPCREGDLVRVLITGADGKTALGEPV